MWRLRSFLLNPPPSRFFSSVVKPPLTSDAAAAVFQIFNSSPTSEAMAESLRKSRIPLSDDLVEQVLKRARFSHSCSLKTLAFFSLAPNPSPFSLDTMLYILGRNRKFDEIWKILHEAKRKDRSLISARTLQVVLGRIAKVCSVRQTVDGFWKFKKLINGFDTPCFNALLRTLTQEKSMADARNVYHSLKRDFRPNLQTFNILLSGWKSSADAESFFAEMAELGVEPDLVSYNCLVEVYCKSREIEKAMEIVEKMREEEIYPDVFTYTSLIGGLGLARRHDEARNMLREMIEHGSAPDVAAYNAAIRNYCIAKRMKDAFSLVEEMESKNLWPNPTTYNLFFRVFYWSNDLENAWRLYRRMRDRGCDPNTQSCMFLVRLSRRQEKPGVALELWDDMVERGFGSYALVSDVLIDMLCDLGMVADAERCFLQMVEKGHRPSFASFKRIRVLLKLANRLESLENLGRRMSSFGVPLDLSG